jgi:hypothetical protein
MAISTHKTKRKYAGLRQKLRASQQSNAKQSTTGSKLVPLTTLGSSKSGVSTELRSNWKETNPKDFAGSAKLPMDLVPDTIEAEVALAYLEGALKYGRYNWRIAGVRSSIYRSALRRHLAKWWNGENRDQITKVKHLASIIACAGILLDAELCGKLRDDRPPRAPISRVVDVEPHIEHLKQLFKNYNPKQYTIADGVADEHDLSDRKPTQRTRARSGRKTARSRT